MRESPRIGSGPGGRRGGTGRSGAKTQRITENANRATRTPPAGRANTKGHWAMTNPAKRSLITVGGT